VAAFSRNIAGNDPNSAIQWAETIGNENTRNSQIESIVASWEKIDPKSATAWVTQSSLPEEAKARLTTLPR
jgi:hypothetical protein